MLRDLASELCPPVEINYNWDGSTKREEYERDFASAYVQHYFPYLLQTLRSHQINPANIHLLDIGCGFAPLAYAFVIYWSSLQRPDEEDIRYLGIDIREDAIGWLREAYKSYRFVAFLHHEASNENDYVGEGNTVARKCISKGKTDPTSGGDEADYDIPDDFRCSLQWSSSVFTHMTPEACVTALKTIARCSMEKCVQVNTWFIIDEESKYALEAGIADRQLPFDCGKFLTYSEDNPLVTTCYKLDAIEQMYEHSDLEIVEIDRGSWRGKAYRNRANHYQDIIVSVPG